MSDVALLIERLGLRDAEVLEIFALDPLSVIADDTAHRPELAILVTLTGEALEQVGATALRSWARVRGADGRTPLKILAEGDFWLFEDRLGELIERGFTLRSSASR